MQISALFLSLEKSMASLYSAASVYSAPPTFLEVLLETSSMLEKYKTDATATKKDVIDSMEQRLSVIIGKLISVPTSTSFSLFRSNLETPEPIDSRAVKFISATQPVGSKLEDSDSDEDSGILDPDSD